MSNIIDDVLEWSPRLALSGMMDKQQTVVDATEPNDNFADMSKTNAEKVPPADGTDGKTIFGQHEDEEIGNTEDSDQNQHQDHV